MKRMRKWLMHAAWLTAAILSISCKEEFPPYRSPENILNPQVTIVAPDTVEVFLDGLTGIYYFNTPLIVRLAVVNMHDDLLEGEARIGGQIVIQSFSQIPRTALIPLSTGNLLRPPVFQGKVAIPPLDSALFSILWVPYATDGNVVFKNLPYTLAGNTKIYGPIDFIATAEVQIFERVQSTRGKELRFSRTFRVRE